MFNNKIIYYLFFITLFFNCSEEHNKLSKKESLIINNCIEYFNQNTLIENDCYGIDPYFYNFLISNYFDSQDESFSEIFKKKTKEDYIKIEKKINKEYFQKYNEDLYNLSSCDKSSNIIAFSGISDEIIIGYLMNNITEVTNEQLKNKYEVISNQIDTFIFLLNKEGGIKKVLTSSVDIW